MSSTHHIFFDPTGKRRRAAITIVLVLAIVAITTITISWVMFLGSPLVAGRLNGMRDPYLRPDSRKFVQSSSAAMIQNSRDALLRELEQTRKLGALQREDKSVHHKFAFTDLLDEQALSSIRLHASDLTALSPAWLHVAEDGNHLSELLFNLDINPINGSLLTLARDAGLGVYPRLILNGSSDQELVRTRAFLRATDRHPEIASEIVAFLDRHQFKGVLIDLPVLTDEETDRVTDFIRFVSQECHKAGKEIGVVIDLDGVTKVSRVAAELDSVVLVNTIRHQTSGTVSSLKQFADRLQTLLSQVPAGKITVAFSSGAIRKREGDTGPVERLNFMTALSEARDLPISFDPISGTSTYTFIEAGGVRGRGSILDAPYSYNTKVIANEGSIGNFGVWNIGGEDPGLWDLLSPKPSLSELEHIPPTSPILLTERGDILSVSLSGIEEGARKVSLDKQSGLITEVTYQSIPSAPTVTRSGYRPKTIALTFDDGPAEPFTAEVLDLLKENNIKGTFFVVGERAIEQPELLRRIFREGHDIGNHTFSHPDLSLVGKNRVTLELNAAQRVIQGILGHSVRLFRPPYVSENSPLSSQEFRTLAIAQDLGYATVGISNNGRDWVKYDTTSDGESIERSGRDIAEEILSKIDLMSGSALLLHDGPKERERSVDALSILIPALKSKGYRFVTVHELMGVSHADIHPPITPGSLQVMHTVAPAVIAYGSLALNALFIGIVTLGVVRLGIIMICSILSRVKELQHPFSPEDFERARDIPVSIVIAAYNEEKVIVKTISSLLQGRHRVFEIIIVDDGSTDRTSDEVAAHYQDNPLITLLRQPNGGKSSALNYGIQHAHHDVFICLDADTQFDPDAITHLAKHFIDPSVGGVAGNIKVGNRRSILTHWQSMEYITNISIGRRAYAFLNAIIVVAGAAGGWRRAAMEQAGGYHSDSLAEDMDLTWRVRRLDWRVVNEPAAIGYTEAPEDFRGLYKQRFRWSYGALQCLWKHRSAFFKNGFFGWVGVPSVLLFGCIFELLAPLADLKMLLTIISAITLLATDHPIYQGSMEYTDIVAPIITTTWLYFIFFGVELLISVLAFYFDKEKMRPLWLLFFQRFVYRQLMYFVAWRALWKALSGWRHGWGVLKRTGTVTLPEGAVASEQKT